MNDCILPTVSNNDISVIDATPTRNQKRLLKHREAHVNWLKERVADGNQREIRIVERLLGEDKKRKSSLGGSPAAAKQAQVDRS